ncbi:MAG TPA: phosphomethylpyrimidine kinase [Sutterella sp.]|nr:phosphomethylpyrimidine kinase [Sutterella sp.]
MRNHILLVSDQAGYGKVALSAQFPVLSHMGYQLYNLPTALVSNTFNYGKFDVLDTTRYMRNTLACWKELGFRFDAVSTGFIASAEQAELVAGLCREQAAQGALIFSDPIMADDGELYCGLTDSTVQFLRTIIAEADVITPNYTEAALLAGLPYRPAGETRETLRAMIDALRGLGAKSVVITSVWLDGRDIVCGFDHARGAYFSFEYERVPVFFPGTGDIFSSVTLGRLLEGRTLEESAKAAARVVYRMVLANREIADKFRGLPIERCLSMID